jgi:translocation and assembly module TamB
VKVLLWMVAGIAILLITLVILLQTCWFQNYLLARVTGYLSKKLDTTVSLGEINITFPKSLYLKDLFIADQSKDTLLYAHELTVDIAMTSLLKKKAIINSLALNEATVHLNRSVKDSAFNFDFILKAFSGPDTVVVPTKTVDTTASAFAIEAGKISLDKVFFTLDDEVGGMKGAARLGHFQTRFRRFDLNKGDLELGQLEWNNSYAHFRQTKITAVDTKATSSLNLRLSAKQLNFSNLDLAYSDTSTGLDLVTKIGQLEGQPDTIDLGRMVFDFKKLGIENSSFGVAVGNAVTDSIAQALAVGDTSTSTVTVRCNNLTINNFNFSYDDKTSAPVKEGMDYAHLHLNNIKGKVNDLFYNGDNIAADIKDLKLNQENGLVIKEAHGNFRMTPTGISFDKGLLVTEGSVIRDRAGISYASLSKISEDVGKLGIFGDFKNADISVKEIVFFNPELARNEYIQPVLDRVLHVDGHVKGTLENMQFSHLNVRTGETEILATGSITGLPDANKLAFNVKLDRFSSTRAEVLALLPDSLLPSDITIPETFTLAGSYSGTLSNFKAAVNLESSFGNAEAMLSMQPGSAAGITSYDGNVVLNHFNVGKLLNQEENVGVITATAKAKGEGFDLVTMNTTLEASVQSAEVKGYTYHDAVMNGTIEDQLFDGSFEIKDSAVALSFQGTASLDPEQPLYNFMLDVPHVDFQELKLSEDDVRFKGFATGNFVGSDLSSLNGSIHVTDAALAVKGKTYPLDSINLVATSNEGKYDWKFRSGMVDVNYTGTSSAAIGVPILINHFNYYFNQQQYNSADTLGAQHFEFDINLHDNSSLLPVFVPGLKSIQPFRISGSFDSDQKALKVLSTPTSVVYNDIHVDSLKIIGSSSDIELDFVVLADKISRDTAVIRGLSIVGSVANDSLNSLISIMTDTSDKDLQLGLSLVPRDKNFRLRLKPDKIIVNNNRWTASPDNYVQFGADGFYVNNLKLSPTDSSSLLIDSKGEEPNTPMELSFDNFNLYELSQVFDTSGKIIAGVVNGNFMLEDFSTYTFTSDLTISRFAFFGQQYGDLALHAKNDTPGKYEVKLTLHGENNKLDVNGYYLTRENGNEIHFDVQMDSVNFALAEPFTKDFIKDLGGSINGNLTIGGSTSDLDVNGKVSFSGGQLVPTATNSVIVLGDQPITFDNSGIHFQSLAIKDIFGNKGTVDGSLLTTDYRNFGFDLNLNAEDFVLMNSNAKVNPSYYGVIRLDCDAALRGDMNMPNISLKAKLRDGTKFTYVYERNDTAFNSEKGVVEFIHAGENLDSIFAIKDTLESMLKGYVISATVEVDDKSLFSIVIDPVAGDRLEVSGDGFFNYEISPSGRMTLTGRYEIASGSYKLTLYNLVKRDFILDPGSAISWSGDPLKADLSISGHLVVRTAPLPLLGDQLTGATEEQEVQYKNPLDFNVFLNITGKLALPQIAFNIELSDKQKGALGGVVDAKLAQLRKEESEMNQQVFALLVLGTFIPEDPLAGGGSASSYINDVARSSVSSLMSSQLNRLSSQYIKGVDVNFDLQSVKDYSAGVEEDKTRLNVGVREKLFNDRLQIYVGTNFDIGGSSVISQPSDLSGDFSLEYLATADGKLRLNLFRRNSYEGIFEGQTVENGISVIYNRDYDKMKEIFKRSKTAGEKDSKKEKEDEENQ